jgi:two-component system OmpR family sensor kinase
VTHPPSPLDAADPACRTQEAVDALRQELAERDDVLALVAHELRNPLHVLSMQLSVARLAAHADPRQAETLARIDKAQATLSRYTDRVTVLLDLVSARGNGYPSRPREVDLVGVLSGLVESLAPEAKYRGVQVELVTQGPCPAFLDPLILEQIVDNLLLNAFKHAACSRVVLTLSVDGQGGMRLEVADNGRGVSPEDRDRIFGKFDVARHSGRGTGTGLGLWIVRRLGAALGGTISLDCPPGGGCAFTLQCPLWTTLPANPSA